MKVALCDVRARCGGFSAIFRAVEVKTEPRTFCTTALNSPNELDAKLVLPDLWSGSKSYQAGSGRE
jgi:hypothetical protein